MRFEAFQGGYATNPATDTLDFTGIDRVFADAEARGVLLIPVLANEWGQCDEGVQKSLDWFNGGFTSLSAPALAAAAGVPVPTLSYLAYVQAFVARYRSSPALAMYEPIGEPDASTCTGQATLDGCSAPWVCNETAATAALRHFYDTVGAAIDALDPQHLIEAGFGSNTACGLEGADLSTVAASTGIDVLSFHDYNGAIPLDTQPAGSSPSDEIGRAAAAGKPIIDAEVGIDASSTDPGCVTPTVHADELLHKEQAQFAAGVSGFLVWNESSAFSGTACDQTMTPSDPALSSVVADPPGGPPPPASATNVADRSVAGLNFAGDDLAGVNLAGYNLSNAKFTASDLTGADLDGATVTGANFTGATLASIHAANLVGSATFSAGWSLVDGDLIGPGVSLTGDDLSGCNLTGMSLAGADLDSAILDGTILTGVDLSGTLLNGVTAQGIIGTPLLPAGWALLGGFLVGPGANLTGVTLPAGTLTNVNLYGATLSGADLRAVHLVHVASGAVVSYWSTQLPTGWSLQGGFLLGPSADLTDATLTGLDLGGVDLSQATLTGAIGRGLTGSPELPASWVVRSGILLGPGANLVGVNFAGANLTGVNLSGANLSNVGLQGATLTGANLTGATLTGAVAQGIQGCPTLGAGWVCGGGFLIGPGVNLAWSNIAGLNLTGVSLAGANLTGANLTNDNLATADLSQATLTDVTSSGLTGVPSLPSGFAVLGGHVVGPTAQLAWDDLHGLNFTGVNLTGANLVGVNFAGANLTGVNLSGANLSNVGLQGATLTGANLTGATLTGAVAQGIQGCPTLGAGWVCGGGFLIGPGVNLAWSNIAGLNLTGVSLAGANLTGANLTNDNLATADLSQATLTDVTSSGLTGVPSLSQRLRRARRPRGRPHSPAGLGRPPRPQLHRREPHRGQPGRRELRRGQPHRRQPVGSQPVQRRAPRGHPDRGQPDRRHLDRGGGPGHPGVSDPRRRLGVRRRISHRARGQPGVVEHCRPQPDRGLVGRGQPDRRQPDQRQPRHRRPLPGHADRRDLVRAHRGPVPSQRLRRARRPRGRPHSPAGLGRPPRPQLHRREPHRGQPGRRELRRGQPHRRQPVGSQPVQPRCSTAPW